MPESGTPFARVVARTAAGAVRGEIVDGVATFRGVPYARIPRRFAAPAPVEPWPGTREATTPSARCPQGEGSLFATSLGDYFTGGRLDRIRLDAERSDEHCLELSILTPAPDPRARRPVLVYLHGGGFIVGSSIGTTAAQPFVAEHDVVLVGVNHRLGAFGFVSGGAPNPGMLDLVAALRWVRGNIAAFGGDPDAVTLVGDSGGAVKIATLLVMPDARGLFHRAVMESPAEFSMRTPEQEAADRAALAAALGSVAALTEATADELFAASVLSPWSYVPVIDGRVVVADPFGEEAAGVMPEVPVIIGHAADEFTMFVADATISEAKAAAVVRLLVGPEASDREALRVEYGVDRLDPATVLRAASDASFGPDVARFARRRAEAGGAVFEYLFTHVPPHDGGAMGAFHTAELALAIGLPQHEESGPLSRVLSAAWAAFARTGDPSTAALAWPALQAGTAHVDEVPSVPGVVPRVVFGDDGGRLDLDGSPIHAAFWAARPARYLDLLTLLQAED
ncbi:carboxylesterase family protein [Herbiconiux moechotypicola]|uniref:Carboxylic ester hydrolase n=1 Tax=Herbiconiux moechotypicola TaxID=637393 RepID=A0ABN3DE41_9MICO|nr:carboxylesterase family protein [Herbiconiux moechotypicola]MCS5729231.1 carboxylesterase family protein [Herbiconiux moechotypicola]